MYIYSKMDAFLEKSERLLALERDAEVSLSEAATCIPINTKMLLSKGACLTRLHVANENIGLYGRQVIAFTSIKKQKLPSHKFTSGDIAGIYAQGHYVSSDGSITGVVVKVTDMTIQVAFESIPEHVQLSNHDNLQLVKLANDITYRRLRKCIEAMRASKGQPLLRACFGEGSFLSPDTRMLPWLQTRGGSGITKVEDTTDLESVSHYNGSCSHSNTSFETGLEGNDKNNHSKIVLAVGDNPEINPYLQDPPSASIQLYNSLLDVYQCRAVQFALSRPDLSIIHGPPGTGKTTTLVEVILQLVKQGKKVLACAPSNVAVDNITERLTRFSCKVVRLGHPARVDDAVQNCSLDAIVARSEAAAIVREVRKDIEKQFSYMQRGRGKDGQSKSVNRKGVWQEIKLLKKELHLREEKALKEILQSASVIAATTTTASPDGVLKCLPEGHFDVVVIDECAQALELSCWVPMLYSKRCILAGDHLQLPPTILSEKAAKEGFNVTLMERLLKKSSREDEETCNHQATLSFMLRVQYRMNVHIMQWPSQFLYENQLLAHHSVDGHVLSDLEVVASSETTDCPIVFIDTAGCDLYELQTEEEESKGNEGEVDLVVHYIRELLSFGVKEKDIAVIAPYNLQVELIRQRLSTSNPNIEIRSVDGFQGREKEAVVITLTRSNTKGEIGFLSEQRRSNVAVTRARRHLTLIGDSNTVSKEPFIKGQIQYIQNHGIVKSAFEYINDPSYESKVLSYTSRAKTSRQDINLVKPVKMARMVVEGNSSKGAGHLASNKSEEEEVLPDVGSQSTQLESASESHDSHVTNAADDILEIEQIKQDILEFTSSSEVVKDFPVTFTAGQRRVVHEFAEEMGLEHVSSGSGNARFIQITKTATSPPNEQQPFGVEDEDMPAKQKKKEKSTLETPSSDVLRCSVCRKLVPQMNFDLHELRCSKPPSMDVKHAASKPKKHTKKSKRGTTSTDGEDFEELISETVKLNSTCSYGQCKASVKLIRQNCVYCGKHFCLSHHLAEVHGCGEMARNTARRQAHSETSTSSRKKVDGNRRSQLKQKLKTQISELEDKRTKSNQSLKKN